MECYKTYVCVANLLYSESWRYPGDPAGKIPTTSRHMVMAIICLIYFSYISIYYGILRGFAKLKNFKNPQKNWIELKSLSNLFLFFETQSDTARTLKSQWLLTTFYNVYMQTEDMTSRSYHMITQSPHRK